MAAAADASGSSPPEGTTGRAWAIVALLWFAACLNYLDRILLTTMRGSLKAAIPMTEAQFGLLTTIFLVVYGVASPFGGFLADRFKRSRVIVFSLLIWSVTTWLTGQAETFSQLFWARAFMGLSEACYIPAALALIADYHGSRTRSLATGLHMTGIFVGSSLGGIGGWLAERHAWHYPFELCGYVGIGYAVVLALTLRDLGRSPAASDAIAPRLRLVDSLTALLGNRPFLLMLLFWGMYGIAGWVILAWMPTYLTERFHLGQSAAGFSATGYFQMSALFGVILGGFWADRWSRRTELARLYVPAVGLGIAGIALLVAAQTDALAVALGGLALCGLFRAFTDANMMPTLCLAVSERHRATGYGILNFLSCLAGGAMIYVGGALRDSQVPLGYIFAASAASLAACAGVLLLLARLLGAGASRRPAAVA